MYSLTETFQRCKVIPGKLAGAAGEGPDTPLYPSWDGRWVWGVRVNSTHFHHSYPSSSDCGRSWGWWGPGGALEASEGVQG